MAAIIEPLACFECGGELNGPYCPKCDPPRHDLRAALDALKQIADHPSQYLWGGNPYAMGLAEGHRVCAVIARKILASHKENTDG